MIYLTYILFYACVVAFGAAFYLIICRSTLCFLPNSCNRKIFIVGHLSFFLNKQIIVISSVMKPNAN